MRRVSLAFFPLLLCLMPFSAFSASIDIIWESVIPPDMPAIEEVTVSPETTALLILDIEELTCNQTRRPRCLETVPRIAALIKRARAAGLSVVYSLTPKGSLDTILPPVTPESGEPVVHSSVDKFWNTDLENILKEKGITSVIVTGTAAHGAVLHTATAAGFRGMRVILPVDCLSAADPYVEQATVILLMTGPGTRKGIAITRSDKIIIK